MDIDSFDLQLHKRLYTALMANAKSVSKTISSLISLLNFCDILQHLMSEKHAMRLFNNKRNAKVYSS